MGSKSLGTNASASPESPASPREFKPRVQSLANSENPRPLKYIHVHHFKTTKLFGAWFNDPSKAGKKVRLFFGSHQTAYLAARAQDRAALKYKPYALDPRSIKLNFKEEDYVEDQKLRDMLTCEEFGELLRKESRPKYTKMEPTPCLRKFLAHERARGNIPSVVPPKEDVIPLHQYLKEVIAKREQLHEDKEDLVSSAEESSEDQESSDEDMEDPVYTAEESSEMEDPVPTAKHKKHALKVERKKRSKGKRIIVSTKPRRTPRSPVAGPSEARKRSKRQEDETSNLQYKFRKLHVDSTEKSREPAPPVKPEDLPTEVVENTKSPEPGNGLPEFPEMQFRSRWHYKMHKIQQQSRTSAGILPNLPAEVESAKTPAAEPGTEGPEFPESQFRSRWHYKQHKIQKLQTSRTASEPSPTPDEASFVEALAITLLSPAEKLV